VYALVVVLVGLSVQRVVLESLQLPLKHR
jgi:hypothetical protein